MEGLTRFVVAATLAALAVYLGAPLFGGILLGVIALACFERGARR